MTLQNKLREIGDALAGVAEHCYHYRRPQMDAPYLVWTETGEGSDMSAGDEKEYQVIGGQAAYFTHQEFDPAVDAIQKQLSRLCVGWSLTDVNYDEETDLTEYLWDFEAACDIEE